MCQHMHDQGWQRHMQVSYPETGCTVMQCTSAVLRTSCDCAGYTEVRPMVFCGLFPTEGQDFEDLRDALGKLQLNDAALQFEPDVRPALCC